MSQRSPRVPLTSKEGWLSDGRQVLRLGPTRWERLVQLLEIIQHYAMLQRNLVYTGITRGKQLVVLVGQKKALAMGVKNHLGR